MLRWKRDGGNGRYLAVLFFATQNTLVHNDHGVRACICSLFFAARWWRDGVRDEEPEAEEDDGFDVAGLEMGLRADEKER